VEKIAGIHVEPIDYGNVPGCTYATPEIASVGLTEKQAREKGYELKMVNFRSQHQNFWNTDGFVKVILMLNMVNG
jgi:dihydrolipoamide dehydrogenase